MFDLDIIEVSFDSNYSNKKNQNFDHYSIKDERKIYDENELKNSFISNENMSILNDLSTCNIKIKELIKKPTDTSISKMLSMEKSFLEKYEIEIKNELNNKSLFIDDDVYDNNNKNSKYSVKNLIFLNDAKNIPLNEQKLNIIVKNKDINIKNNINEKNRDNIFDIIKKNKNIKINNQNISIDSDNDFDNLFVKTNYNNTTNEYDFKNKNKSKLNLKIVLNKDIRRKKNLAKRENLINVINTNPTEESNKEELEQIYIENTNFNLFKKKLDNDEFMFNKNKKMLKKLNNEVNIFYKSDNVIIVKDEELDKNIKYKNINEIKLNENVDVNPIDFNFKIKEDIFRKKFIEQKNKNQLKEDNKENVKNTDRVNASEIQESYYTDYDQKVKQIQIKIAMENKNTKI